MVLVPPHHSINKSFNKSINQSIKIYSYSTKSNPEMSQSACTKNRDKRERKNQLSPQRKQSATVDSEKLPCGNKHRA